MAFLVCNNGYIPIISNSLHLVTQRGDLIDHKTEKLATYCFLPHEDCPTSLMEFVLPSHLLCIYVRIDASSSIHTHDEKPR